MVAAAVDVDEAGRIAWAGVAVGACSAAARRLPALEAALLGTPGAALADTAARALRDPAALAPLAPIDDVRGTARYRLDAAATLVARALGGLSPVNHPSAPIPALAAAAEGAAAPRATVNGIELPLGAVPAKRLSDGLRDDLGLVGTKVGCSAGDCGACTVLIDGEQACACLVPVGQCEGAAVTTVEGLAEGGAPSALQRAFVEHGAAQCGICTPGMLMAATDVLRRHPRPTESQVLDGLAGVLCRCTGYRKDRRCGDAVAHGAAAPVADESPAAGAAVGARLPRLDGPAKVLGTELFGADEAPADALWLRAIRSPHPHARFELGDLDAFVRARPGLVGVVLPSDIPNNRFAIFPTCATSRRSPRASRASAARRCWCWSAGATRSRRSSRPRCRSNGRRCRRSRRRRCARRGGPRRCMPVIRTTCCAAAASRAATSSARSPRRRAARRCACAPRTSSTPTSSPRPAGRAGRRARDDAPPSVEVFACTQTPYMDRDELAFMFGLPPQRVRIVPSAVGGGFGGKLDVSIQPLLVAASRKFGRPARIVYGRPESMASTTKRHPADMTATLAAGDDGTLLAYDFHGDFDTGAYASWGPTVANRVPIHASGPYRFGAVRATTRAVHTHGPVSGAFRGFGVPQSTIVVEALLDELAIGTGTDPLELRHAHALRAGDTTPTGQRLEASVGLRACLDALRPAWRAARAAAEAFNATAAGPLRRGVGVACMWYGIGNTVIANPSTMTVGLRPDGRFVLYNGAVDIGQGTYTIMPQMAADALGVPVGALDQVRARHRADRGCRQELGIAPDLRVGQRGAARRRGPAAPARRAGRAAAADAARATLRTDGGTLVVALDGPRGRGRPAGRCRSTPTATSRSARAASTRRPCRSTPTARACPTQPTASPRSSPRSRSTSGSARRRCCRCTRRTTSVAR